MPRGRMFAGPNGSGKSTLYDSLVQAGHFHAVPFVNADVLQRQLNGGEGVAHDEVPTADAFSGLARRLRRSSFPGVRTRVNALMWSEGGVRMRARERCDGYLAAGLADAIRGELVDAGRSFSFETVMSDERKLDFLRRSRRAGYRVYLYFVTTGDVTINVARVAQRLREGGHGVEEAKVRARFHRSMTLLPRALRLSDRAYLFDSAGATHEHVATYDRETRMLRLTTPETPAWVEALLR